MPEVRYPEKGGTKVMPPKVEKIEKSNKGGK